MAEYSIIITGPTGNAVFTPDLPGAQAGDPLKAKPNDLVSWNNKTKDPHTITVQGQPVTDPIDPGKPSSGYLIPGTATGQIEYGCANHSNEHGFIQITALVLALLLAVFAAPPLRAQTADDSCNGLIGQRLETLPEIVSSGGYLRGTLVTTAEQVRMPERTTNTFVSGSVSATVRCPVQTVRAYRVGPPLATGGELGPAPRLPLPGPVLRARVGDLVELTFLNQIDPGRFVLSEDDCTRIGVGGSVYPGTAAKSDKMPDCFHASAVTNVHYHGTHTNPNSSGDNVFLQIEPSPRVNDKPIVTVDTVRDSFTEFFKACEAQLARNDIPKQWPRIWTDFPESLRNSQNDLLSKYYKPQYDQNQSAVAHGAWPQNYVGAFPYCYRLPVYTPTDWPPAPQSVTTSAQTQGAGAAEHDEALDPKRPLIMGQAPGTHWYHAHKHGSTTINVSNGMTGVFVIEGKYDDDIDATYGKGWTRTQPVLVINQLGGTSNLEKGGAGAFPKGQYFSVNGRLQPVIRMQAEEVQMWRIANTSARAGAYFLAPKGLHWRQLAQDGVQFANENYLNSKNKAFLLMSGNRADILVKAPALSSTSNNLYDVVVYNTVDPSDRAPGAKPVPLTLFTVEVVGPAKKMDFLKKAPEPPPFLADITDKEVKGTKTLVFASSALPPGPPITSAPAHHTIDGKLFNGEVGALVLLNHVEEWKVVNETYAANGNQISHPFHIHINPFQIVEVFDPNDTVPDPNKKGGTLPKYIFYKKKDMAKGQCYLDPHNDATWKPCTATAPKKNRIWWDVFPIPSGVSAVDGNGKPIKDSKGKQIKVPGYFKMRSRFVDYAGYYVLHCHILAHEDRGMMTVVEVAPLQPPFSHH